MATHVGTGKFVKRLATKPIVTSESVLSGISRPRPLDVHEAHPAKAINVHLGNFRRRLPCDIRAFDH